MLSGVVFDTNHARRDLRGDELARMQSRPGTPVTPAFNTHLQVLKAVGGDIKLIDFQALNDRELQDTLAGKSTELADLIEELMEQYPEVPIRIEFRLGIMRQLQQSEIMETLLAVQHFLRQTHTRVNMP